MRHVAAVWLVVVFGLCLSDRAAACDCGSLSTCRSFWNAQAVFVGRVIYSDPTAVRLVVVERFRGSLASEVTISGPLSNCRYPFTEGVTYLVFAHETPSGELEAGLCSRTQPLTNAGGSADLAYARYARSVRASDRGRIVGTVELPDAAWQPLPLPPQVRVSTQTADGRTLTAAVNRRGEFRFEGLPQGIYRLEVSAPGGFQGEIEEVEVNDPRGCDQALVRLLWGGMITGDVRDSTGAPVAGVPLQITALPDGSPVSPWAIRSARSREEGRFTFETVPPGGWRLELDPSLLSGGGRPPRDASAGSARPAAAVVTVPRNQPVTLPFVVPSDAQIVTIAGVAVDADGKPLANAEVTLGNGVGAVGNPHRTGPDGRFSLAAVAGEKYTVYAVHHLPETGPTLETRSAVVPLVADPGTSPLRLVLERSF
jgi:hypothetical protein